MGEIAACAGRMKGAGLLCGATVTLRIGPVAKRKAVSSRAQSKGWRHHFARPTGLTFNHTLSRSAPGFLLDLPCFPCCHPRVLLSS